MDEARLIEILAEAHAEIVRIRENFIRFYDNIEEAHRRDNTGDHSSVATTLAMWKGVRSATRAPQPLAPTSLSAVDRIINAVTSRWRDGVNGQRGYVVDVENMRSEIAAELKPYPLQEPHG